MNIQSKSLTNTTEMSKQDTYTELKKQFSDQELVEGYVFPSDLDEQEKNGIETEFKALRIKALKETTEEQRLLSGLMRMKLLIKDYLEIGVFDRDFSFAKQLGDYIKLLGRSQNVVAAELDLESSHLSRLITEQRRPTQEVIYRLEKHGGHVIPAIYWWKLYALQLEDDIKSNEALRSAEWEKVKNNLKFRA
jgi:plasmid maintenance system antidote protein VapI